MTITQLNHGENTTVTCKTDYESKPLTLKLLILFLEKPSHCTTEFLFLLSISSI